MFKFDVGEKVLCFHRSLLYEAKVVRKEFREKIPCYLVHYSGWNKNWDEWVPESRILKHNEENLKKQKDIHDSIGNSDAPQRSVLLKQADERQDSDSSNRRRRTRPVYAEEEDPSKPRHGVTIMLPHRLVHHLIDDRDMIRQMRLVTLPKPSGQCVKAILNAFVQHSMKECAAEDRIYVEGILRQTARGIEAYFDSLLLRRLLYRFERPQYHDVIVAAAEGQSPHARPTPSTVYGAEHLVRLFLKMGSVLQYSLMNADAMVFTLRSLHDFLAFFSCSSATWFNRCYSRVTEEYTLRVGNLPPAPESWSP